MAPNSVRPQETSMRSMSASGLPRGNTLDTLRDGIVVGVYRVDGTRTSVAS